MLREWILNLVYAIRFIPGTLNYADLMTKPLGLEPYRRFRDALLSGKIVFPASTAHTGTQSSYVSRLTQYILHALSLPEHPAG